MKTFLSAQEIRLVLSGKDFFDALREVIDNSTETLHLQTYIFEYDATGREVVDALNGAAARGVKVNVLLDAYGSFNFPGEVARQLKNAGVSFRFFSPFFHQAESIYTGRRLHHKIVVADNKVGLTGGINIADKYNSTPGTNAWLDYAVLVKGQACEYLHLLCEKLYHRLSSASLKKWELSIHTSAQASTLVRFTRNDWVKGQNEIHRSYVNHLNLAQKRIVIVASYFLPSKAFLKVLELASRRGVSINIILAGLSDVWAVRLAERYLYDHYLRANIRLFEWKNSVMHGKAMIADGNWATVGSYNVNFLSHYLSIELNAEIIDRTFAGKFEAHLLEITTKHCTPIDLAKEKHTRNFFRKMILWLAYKFFSSFMGMVFTRKRIRRRIRRGSSK